MTNSAMVTERDSVYSSYSHPAATGLSSGEPSNTVLT